MTSNFSLEEILLQTADMPWRAKSLAGVHERPDWYDNDEDAR